MGQGTGLPADTAFSALGRDLHDDLAHDSIYEFAKSLNFRLPGARSHVLRTARQAGRGQIAKPALIEIDPHLGRPGDVAGDPRRAFPVYRIFLLNSLDLRPSAQGIVFVPPDQALFLRVFGRTFLVAAIVTLVTLVGAFPLAWLAAHLPPKTAAVLIILVLLPFWTSILVRTAAWTVVLQKTGLINELMLLSGLTRHSST